MCLALLSWRSPCGERRSSPGVFLAGRFALFLALPLALPPARLAAHYGRQLHGIQCAPLAFLSSSSWTTFDRLESFGAFFFWHRLDSGGSFPDASRVLGRSHTRCGHRRSTIATFFGTLCAPLRVYASLALRQSQWRFLSPMRSLRGWVGNSSSLIDFSRRETTWQHVPIS